jgi:hypothetical protein
MKYVKIALQLVPLALAIVLLVFGTFVGELYRTPQGTRDTYLNMAALSAALFVVILVTKMNHWPWLKIWSGALAIIVSGLVLMETDIRDYQGFFFPPVGIALMARGMWLLRYPPEVKPKQPRYRAYDILK